MNDGTRWREWVPWVSLAAFALFWAARWPTFPLILDPYYHLLVAQQILTAGGPIGYEWWEYAPVGRPHLYPPVLHLILAVVIKVTGSPLCAIRLLSACLPPALLGTIYVVMRRLVSPTVALACAWSAMLPFTYHLQAASTMAATIGAMELLWLIVAIEENRPVAGGLLLALLFYTHLTFPWIAVLMLISAAAFRPKIRMTLARAAWGLLLALPWWWHLWHYRTFLHVLPRYENRFVELMPLLYAIAAIGAWRCVKQGQRGLWLLACWIGFLLFAVHHQYRWLSGEGLLPILLFAGVGLSWLSEVAGAGSFRIGALLFLALAMSPTLSRAEERWRWLWRDSAPWHFLAERGVTRKTVDVSFYSPEIERLVTIVKRETRPDDILWSNTPHVAGLVAALALRPMSAAMLEEVPPVRAFDAIGAAKLVLWLKIDPLPGTIERTVLAHEPLTPIADTPLAVIFRRAGVVETARAPQARLPLTLAVGLLVVAVALAGADLGRSRQAVSLPV